MPRWEVDASDLHDAFKRMRRFAKGKTGDAGWTFQGGEVLVEWAGMGINVPVSGDAELVVQIASKDMHGLVRVPTDGTGKIVLLAEDGRLWLDSISVPCRWRTKPVSQLLPVGATSKEVALLPYLYSPEDIADADLTVSVEAVQDRAAESVERAAKSLSWLGIDAGLLGGWVDAHMRAVSKGEPTFSMESKAFVVVDEMGQIDMFGVSSDKGR